jgi:hypothetical protein
MKVFWRAVPSLLLLIAATSARAEERISRFVSDVQVQKDSSLEVTETIDVRAEHNQINRGIYRDFPTRYRSRNGAQMRVGFTFHGAILDGTPVQASTETISNGVRIRIGDPEKLVNIGDHRYVIRYGTTRQVGHFKDFDELYWNATGLGWGFPIDVAEARIRLPAPVKFGQRAAYTGPEGSTSSNTQVVEEKPGELSFRTTLPLAPYEGLTVAAAFPKGVVDAPNESKYWLTDYGPPLGWRRRPSWPAWLLFLRLETRRTRSARGDGRPDFLPARRSYACGHAVRHEDGRGRSDICSGAHRHGGSGTHPNGRRGRRLVVPG